MTEANHLWCERAWVGDQVLERVAITCDAGGVITSVSPGSDPGGARILSGLVFPGFANTHSHAFHRALRGRTHEHGSFWTWREAMYRLANRLDPSSYLDLATATYAEMVLAGFSTVGEFHYLHHQPSGEPYDNPNEMAELLRDAAKRAGIRLTLLDACYLTGGIGEPLNQYQMRFGDGDAGRWAERFTLLKPDENTVIGAAVHSVRAVPADQLSAVAKAVPRQPLHVHVSEQAKENEECRAVYRVTPAQLLYDQSVLGPFTTAIHATHLARNDIGLLAGSGSGACICPTTERDLGDGVGPVDDMARAGSPISLGTDQHAVVDPFEEMRGLEMNVRLITGERGIFDPAVLVAAATTAGHRALGWPSNGRISVGSSCDLVSVDLDSVRTAGSEPAQAIMTATSADVRTVVIGGREIVNEGRHEIGDVARMMEKAVNSLWA